MVNEVSRNMRFKLQISAEAKILNYFFSSVQVWRKLLRTANRSIIFLISTNNYRSKRSIELENIALLHVIWLIGLYWFSNIVNDMKPRDRPHLVPLFCLWTKHTTCGPTKYHFLSWIFLLHIQYLIH